MIPAVWDWLRCHIGRHHWREFSNWAVAYDYCNRCHKVRP